MPTRTGFGRFGRWFQAIRNRQQTHGEIVSNPQEQEIIAALSGVNDPERNADVITLGMVQGLQISDGVVRFALEIDPREAEAKEPLRMACIDAVRKLPGIVKVVAVLTAHSDRTTNTSTSPRPATNGSATPEQSNLRPQVGQAAAADKPGIPGVSKVIAVASGKGGVGKSTTAVNLALALAAAGRRVGLLDADIYGPSIPRMLGISGKPTSPDGHKLNPMENFGIKCMSIGFLVDEDTPMIWRGPMVMSALNQMMSDVNWGTLDVMVVDMPPGTGDAQLTMAQKVPMAGAVIVSTPQEIALIDARRGLAMFERTKVPVLGIIENMSYFAVPGSDEKHYIFGHGGARDTAAKLGCDFLGEIPIYQEIRETADAGTPIVASAPDSAAAQVYREIAEKILSKLDATDRATQRDAPRIVIE